MIHLAFFVLLITILKLLYDSHNERSILLKTNINKRRHNYGGTIILEPSNTGNANIDTQLFGKEVEYSDSEYYAKNGIEELRMCIVLKAELMITKIIISNEKECAIDAYISIDNDNDRETYTTETKKIDTISLPKPVIGKSISLHFVGKKGLLQISEIKIHATPETLLSYPKTM